MPKIIDNSTLYLHDQLGQSLAGALHADFCVGYFNLRGWRTIADRIDALPDGPPERPPCRVLVGMQRTGAEALRRHYRLEGPAEEQIDTGSARRLKEEAAREFARQLTLGLPTNADEAGLQQLRRQLLAGRVRVRLHTRFPLHAKLYLVQSPHVQYPHVGYLGSSNLTFAGLAHNGELNIDVPDQDACLKLAAWFADRWDDRFSIDITDELAAIIGQSWARDELIPPYHIYLNMAYHLSQEARAGIAEFRVPAPFDEKLFDFQKKAVLVAARHLNRRGGVLIGDVVGLGKTLMATALAKLFEEDQLLETLIICPRNLVSMWQWHVDHYHLRAKVLPISVVQQKLHELPIYRIVLIDESHNLRNREGKRYKAVRDYIHKNGSRVILLSATPYNKNYADLSSQLRLFLEDEDDLGIRPDRMIRKLGSTDIFRQRYDDPPLRSLKAFEKSDEPDDWRELMRLFMVRRTRSFIKENYAATDADGRKYLTYADGRRNYFPRRVPHRISFALDEANPDDQYARLYSEGVVTAISQLALPRYGLGTYVNARASIQPSAAEQVVLGNLYKGGRRLQGFARTNLFKRLESSGHAFLLSLRRHILRNYIFLHALEHDLPLPIGPQSAELLDTRFEDEDAEDPGYDPDALVEHADDSADSAAAEVGAEEAAQRATASTEADLRRRAAEIYARYAGPLRRRFGWLRAGHFRPTLARDLHADSRALLAVLRSAGAWDPDRDSQLDALHKLLTVDHPRDKLLIFSQFADTVDYLARELQRRGVARVAGVTGSTTDVSALVRRFSPVSSDQRAHVAPADELRVLIATDLLSEGQNLQDAHVIVNYDLPWAIIRLIQRAGRVDRIGQQADTIDCYMFWPAEGVERLIRLRSRLKQRLEQNHEVIGSDEQFFEDESHDDDLRHLYHERADALEADALQDGADGDIDLVSHAYEIWNQATRDDKKLAEAVAALPANVYSAKQFVATAARPAGVLLYLQSGLGNSTLAWLNAAGESVTENQFEILGAARCEPDAPALPRAPGHHDLVEQGVRELLRQLDTFGGQLGTGRGARRRTYGRLKEYLLQPTLFETPEQIATLNAALEQIYTFPLRDTARDKLNRQLRTSIRDDDLAALVRTLYEEDRLCVVQEDEKSDGARIISTLGLIPTQQGWL